MKIRLSLVLALTSLLFFPALPGKEEETLAREQKIDKLTHEQDELQADVQELVAEQTNEEVIALLEECQLAMNEAIDELEAKETGGKTIAAQTEVIEKIFQAAEKKSESDGNAESMKGMLEMMKGLMNHDSSSDEKKESGAAKDKPGLGGDTNGDASGTSPGPEGTLSREKKQARRLPKASGNAGIEYPREFARAMEAYNKDMEKARKPEKGTAAP